MKSADSINPFSDFTGHRISELDSIKAPPMSPGLKILIFIFWLIQIWTSPYLSKEDFTKYNYTFIFGRIDTFLQEASLVGNRFALQEFLLLLLAFLLLKNYGIYSFRDKISKKIFYVSLITIFLCFINPNNSFDQIRYILSYEPRILLYFIFMLFVFMSINKRGLIALLYYSLVYGLVLAIAQSLLSTFMFVMGNGVKFLGSATTIPNSEIVNVLVIFSTICLSVYLSSHKRIYLFFVVLLHITIFFADRRTPLAVLFITDTLVFIYYRKKGSRLLIKAIITVLLLFFTVYILNKETTIDLDYFILRIYAVFGGKIQEYGDLFTDMGHWEQTKLTFATLLGNLDVFWGGGMRNLMFYVSGQSGYVHNSFVAVWALYGLPMTIYLLFILTVFASKTLSYFRQSKQHIYHPILAPVIFSYMMIMMGDSFTGEFFSKHFAYASLFILILSFLRINNEEEDYLYDRIVYLFR